ncbi:MAG: tryptophan--tRNA ligase [Anaerolineae bacterium]|nr:tryptophan--tRNA ligase [Anaerolineales bacterium]MCQ3976824.1 tryptophan--tRNA ligase [Anaerolineae bacterium]
MNNTQTGKKRVFSGIQPSGNLHIGNYLGAIKNWVAEQHKYHNVFCIVDLHALTVPQDPAELYQKTREVALLYLACGIDLEHCAIFAQSHISAHSELTWLLNCVTPLGWLERMTQYKDKAAKQESVGVGLLDYPVLMAADIILYDSHYVPVGEDQKQHVELTRDIAIRFNNLYGETFVVPDVLIPKAGARVKGLDDPTAKMSKSSVTQGHALRLLDPPDVLRKSIMRATTDSLNRIAFDPENQPGVYNLLNIYQAITNKSQAEILAEFEGKGYGNLKKQVAEAVIAALEPMQTRYYEMAQDPAYIEQILKEGADRVRPIAEHRLRVAQERLGLRK